MMPPLHSAEMWVAGLRHDIAQARLRMDGDRLARGVPIDTAVCRSARLETLVNSQQQPAREIELPPCSPSGWMRTCGAFAAQKMHGVSDHHSAFVQVVLMGHRTCDAVGGAPAPSRDPRSPTQLPVLASERLSRTGIDSTYNRPYLPGKGVPVMLAYSPENSHRSTRPNSVNASGVSRRPKT